MPSHMDPPPPCSHHLPAQVFAAASMALFSNPFEGSPGVTQNFHSSLPVFTSNAETYPRNGGNSAPALPMNTLPFATRGAIVSEYEEISPCFGSGIAHEDQMSLPVAASTACMRPSITGMSTLSSYSAIPRVFTPQQRRDGFPCIVRSACGS